MLGFSPLPRTLEAALRDVTSQSADVRRSAISDLVVHAQENTRVHAQAIMALRSLLADRAAPVRSTAALALAELRGAAALPELTMALSDDDAYVREMAMTALGEIGDARAIESVEGAYGSGGPELRYQAVIAFSRLVTDRERVVALLQRALADEEAKVRYIALRVAEEQGLTLSVPQALLEDASADVAFACAIYLGKLGDDAARAMVESVVVRGTLRGQTVPKEDEAEGVELMGTWARTTALSALQRRAYGLRRMVQDTCGFHARIALARLGDPRASREILAGLESPLRETRAASVVLAGRARMQGARARIEALRVREDIDPALVDEALALLGERSP